MKRFRPWRSIDVDETADQVSDEPVEVGTIIAINLHTSPLYLKFYDVASPTVGTTTPVWTVPIPAESSGNGAGYTLPFKQTRFEALSIACTTALADNDTGAPSANVMIVNMEVRKL